MIKHLGQKHLPFRNLVRGGFRINKVIFHLVTSVPFISLTILGNLTIGLFAFVFYRMEGELNHDMGSYMDALWWSFSTATTVGYGDIIPLTDAGKVLGIILMLTGTALFATYTALFAHAIIEDDVLKLRRLSSSDIHSDNYLESLKKHHQQVKEQISYLEKDQS